MPTPTSPTPATWADFFLFAGAAALIAGAAWIYPPAGLIVFGVLAIVAAVSAAP
jgi:uncharacterized membrane protein